MVTSLCSPSCNVCFRSLQSVEMRLKELADIAGLISSDRFSRPRQQKTALWPRLWNDHEGPAQRSQTPLKLTDVLYNLGARMLSECSWTCLTSFPKQTRRKWREPGVKREPEWIPLLHLSTTFLCVCVCVATGSRCRPTVSDGGRGSPSPARWAPVLGPACWTRACAVCLSGRYSSISVPAFPVRPKVKFVSKHWRLKNNKHSSLPVYFSRSSTSLSDVPISVAHFQELKGGKAYAKVGLHAGLLTVILKAHLWPRFTIIRHTDVEWPKQTDGGRRQQAAASLSTDRGLDRAGWVKPPSPETAHSSPFLSSFPPSARFCGSEFSRVRRLRKHNPQMSAGRLRYQKYPPGQLHSQGELKKHRKAAAPVWSESPRWGIHQRFTHTRSLVFASARTIKQGNSQNCWQI